MFVSGNDVGAKGTVTKILANLGRIDIVDQRGIPTAGGIEMMLPAWVRTWMATGDGYVAFKIVRKQSPAR